VTFVHNNRFVGDGDGGLHASGQGGRLQQGQGQVVDGQMSRSMMPSLFEGAGVEGGGGVSGGLPDAPMVDGGSQMLRILIDGDDIPDRAKRDFFWVYAKDNILTFLDEDRKRQKLLLFDIIKLHSLHNLGYYEYTYGKELEWAEARFMLETRLDRAMGFEKGNRVNERIVEQAQFNEQRQIMSDEGAAVQRPGFFGKIANAVLRR
jgi:hypothetical protein